MLFISLLLVAYVTSGVVFNKEEFLDDGLKMRYIQTFQNRAVIIPEFDLLLLAVGCTHSAPPAYRAELRAYTMSDFTLKNTYVYNPSETETTDYFMRYDPISNKLFVLVDYGDTGNFDYFKKVYFFDITYQDFIYVGESDTGNDFNQPSGDITKDNNCNNRDSIWLDGKIYVLFGGTECMVGDEAFIIYIYDTAIGYDGHSSPWTQRFLFETKAGRKLFFWKNMDTLETHSYVIDFNGFLHKYDFNTYAVLLADQDIYGDSSFSTACRDIALVSASGNNDGRNSVIEDRYIYIVFTWETLPNIVIILLDMNTLEVIQRIDHQLTDELMVNGPAITKLFVETEYWIFYLFGMKGVLKYRINPNDDYRLFNEDIDEEDSQIKPMYVQPFKFATSNLGYAGMLHFEEIEILQPQQGRSNPTLYNVMGVGILNEDFTTTDDVYIGYFNLSWWDCPKGFFIDSSLSESGDDVKIMLDQEIPSVLCMEYTDGRFGRYNDPQEIESCELGTFPINMENESAYFIDCVTCEIGYYTEEIIYDENGCLPCPAGTYNEDSPSSSVEDCIPCPANTYNPYPAQSSLSSCLECDTDRYLCAIGSNELIEKATLTLDTIYSQINLNEESGDEEWVYPLIYKLISASSIVLICCCCSFHLLFILCFYDICFNTGKMFINCLICKSSGGETNCFCFLLQLMECFRPCRYLDYFYSEFHGANEGESPIKRKTGCGGVFSMFAFIGILTFCCFSIIDFVEGNKEIIETTQLYFETDELITMLEDYLFFFKIHGNFDSCDLLAPENNEDISTGFFISEKEVMECNINEEGGGGCLCEWKCKKCSISDSSLSVTFNFDNSDGNFINAIEFGSSVPHYNEDETFDLNSGITYENGTIENLNIEIILYKTTYKTVSDISLITRIVGYTPGDSKTGISLSLLTKKIEKSSPTSKTELEVKFDLSLSSFQYHIQEQNKQSALNFISQLFALFSLSISVCGLFFSLFDRCSSIQVVSNFFVSKDHDEMKKIMEKDVTEEIMKNLDFSKEDLGKIRRYVEFINKHDNGEKVKFLFDDDENDESGKKDFEDFEDFKETNYNNNNNNNNNNNCEVEENIYNNLEEKTIVENVYGDDDDPYIKKIDSGVDIENNSRINPDYEIITPLRINTSDTLQVQETVEEKEKENDEQTTEEEEDDDEDEEEEENKKEEDLKKKLEDCEKKIQNLISFCSNLIENNPHLDCKITVNEIL